MQILWVITMKETMLVDPECSFTVHLTKVVKVELANQRLEPRMTKVLGQGL